MLTISTSGLITEEVIIGAGAEAVPGENVAVHHTGWLADGTPFDSSRDHDHPLVFPLGEGCVIKGWDEGLVGMKVGGTRRLIIPPTLAYGTRGVMGVIPPNATIICEVELLAVGCPAGVADRIEVSATAIFAADTPR